MLPAILIEEDLGVVGDGRCADRQGQQNTADRRRYPCH